MIYLIAGATHTGKTLLAQKLLEKRRVPYLSLDHLKMGLIRSGMTDLTVFDDDKLTDLLWPIVREMIKTAIENGQNLTVEGCYIPFTWRRDFPEHYADQIACRWLIMSPEYIETHFEEIRAHANAIEQRLDDSDLHRDVLIRENLENLRQCESHGCEYILIQNGYQVDIP